VRAENPKYKLIALSLLISWIIIGWIILFVAFANAAGQHSDNALHKWFDSLRSTKGLCCSVADGRSVSDPNWGTKDDHYWVIVDGIRYAVPQDAVVTAPNIFGQAVVWPYKDEQNQVAIRCFMPGGGV